MTAASAGVLDETHWVELKEAVPASSRPANLELARDLASLSVDGGVLIIGIEDAKGSAGEVVGTELSGLETRVAQVATGRVSPPLPVTMDIIAEPEQIGRGVVIVTVPTSEGAPHMVDGHYWGRDAHGKRTLSDDEVRRLLAERQTRAAGFADRLRAEPAHLDPHGLGDDGRLYVRIEPATALREPVSDLLAGTHTLQVVLAALGFDPQWTPSLDSVSYGVPHPHGVGARPSSPATSPTTATPTCSSCSATTGPSTCQLLLSAHWAAYPVAPQPSSPPARCSRPSTALSPSPLTSHPTTPVTRDPGGSASW